MHFPKFFANVPVSRNSRYGDSIQMAENESVVGRGRRYFSESVEELKKVSSPTKQETMQATLVTTVIVVFIATVVALLDLVFGQLMGAILS